MVSSRPPGAHPVRTSVVRPTRADVIPAVRPAMPPPATTISYSSATALSAREHSQLAVSLVRGLLEGGSHVGLDLRLGPSHVVEAHLVDRSPEVLSVDRVSTDLQGIRRRRDAPRSGPTCHLNPVHVKPDR